MATSGAESILSTLNPPESDIPVRFPFIQWASSHNKRRSGALEKAKKAKVNAKKAENTASGAVEEEAKPKAARLVDSLPYDIVAGFDRSFVLGGFTDYTAGNNSCEEWKRKLNLLRNLEMAVVKYFRVSDVDVNKYALSLQGNEMKNLETSGSRNTASKNIRVVIDGQVEMTKHVSALDPVGHKTGTEIDNEIEMRTKCFFYRSAACIGGGEEKFTRHLTINPGVFQERYIVNSPVLLTVRSNFPTEHVSFQTKMAPILLHDKWADLPEVSDFIPTHLAQRESEWKTNLQTLHEKWSSVTTIHEMNACAQNGKLQVKVDDLDPQLQFPCLVRVDSVRSGDIPSFPVEIVLTEKPTEDTIEIDILRNVHERFAYKCKKGFAPATAEKAKAQYVAFKEALNKKFYGVLPLGFGSFKSSCPETRPGSAYVGGTYSHEVLSKVDVMLWNMLSLAHTVVDRHGEIWKEVLLPQAGEHVMHYASHLLAEACDLQHSFNNQPTTPHPPYTKDINPRTCALQLKSDNKTTVRWTTNSASGGAPCIFAMDLLQADTGSLDNKHLSEHWPDDGDRSESDLNAYFQSHATGVWVVQKGDYVVSKHRQDSTPRYFQIASSETDDIDQPSVYLREVHRYLNPDFCVCGELPTATIQWKAPDNWDNTMALKCDDKYYQYAFEPNTFDLIGLRRQRSQSVGYCSGKPIKFERTDNGLIASVHCGKRSLSLGAKHVLSDQKDDTPMQCLQPYIEDTFKNMFQDKTYNTPDGARRLWLVVDEVVIATVETVQEKALRLVLGEQYGDIVYGIKPASSGSVFTLHKTGTRYDRIFESECAGHAATLRIRCGTNKEFTLRPLPDTTLSLHLHDAKPGNQANYVKTEVAFRDPTDSPGCKSVQVHVYDAAAEKMKNAMKFRGFKSHDGKYFVELTELPSYENFQEYLASEEYPASETSDESVTPATFRKESGRNVIEIREPRLWTLVTRTDDCVPIYVCEGAVTQPQLTRQKFHIAPNGVTPPEGAMEGSCILQFDNLSFICETPCPTVRVYQQVNDGSNEWVPAAQSVPPLDRCDVFVNPSPPPAALSLTPELAAKINATRNFNVLLYSKTRSKHFMPKSIKYKTIPVFPIRIGYLVDVNLGTIAHREIRQAIDDDEKKEFNLSDLHVTVGGEENQLTFIKTTSFIDSLADSNLLERVTSVTQEIKQHIMGTNKGLVRLKDSYFAHNTEQTKRIQTETSTPYTFTVGETSLPAKGILATRRPFALPKDKSLWSEYLLDEAFQIENNTERAGLLEHLEHLEQNTILKTVETLIPHLNQFGLMS